jgi:hypothetical protein
MKNGRNEPRQYFNHSVIVKKYLNRCIFLMEHGIEPDYRIA